METTSKEGGVATNKLGMRTSCDDCGRKKRKCDGGTPCRRCFRAGNKCTYSKRRCHQLQPQAQRQQQRPNPAGTHGTDNLLHAASGALRAYGMLSLKRCKLSASPATGLVGMQENAFLSDFFGCVGFLPLTTQSHIRGTLVEIMASPATRQPSGSMLDWEEQRQFGTIATEASLNTAMEGNHLPMDPSTCIFWCAVALGALVKGSPVELVADYCQLARDALESYSGPANVEVAQAWTILGYLYGFMGEMATFQKYMDLSSSFLTASIKQGSTDLLPVGFAEVINHRDAEEMRSAELDLGEIESFCAKPQDAPQIDDVTDERGLYRYVTQSSMVFGQAVFTKAYEKSAIAGGCSEDDEPCEGGNGSSDGGNPHPNGLLAENVANAMAEGLKENIIEFEVLEEAVERPTIGAGIGGLIINGLLFFEKAAKGDVCGTLERTRRCIEVYERYPGLCRCTVIWFHLAHAIPAALATMGGARARELYNRLRAVYNPSRPPGSLPVPPLEEWNGISSFCEDYQCRTLEGLIAIEAWRNLSTPLGPEQHNCEGEKSLCLDGQNKRGVVSAGIAPEEMIGSTPVGRYKNRVELCETATTAYNTSQESAQHVNPAVTSAPSPYDPQCESEMVLKTDVVKSSGTAGVEHGCGGIVGLGAPDAAFILPAFSETDGPTVDSGDDGIAASDWLDVAHAMLDAPSDLDPASR